MRQRRAARLRGRAQHQDAQRRQVAAQPLRGLTRRGRMTDGRSGRARQMQGQRVRPLGAARGQQQQAEAFGGDLGVGDAPLHQAGRGRVGRALLQPGLDQQGRLVQPRGAVAQPLQRLVDGVGTGVQQLDLRRDELRQPGAERLPQQPQDARGRRRDHPEAHHRAGGERHGDGGPQPRQPRHLRADEQRHEVDLEADQSERGAPVAEAADEDRAEDQDDEEGVTDHDPRGEQRAQRDRGQRDGQAERQRDGLRPRLLLPDGEGRDHRRHGARHQMLDVHAERGEHAERQRDGADRPQTRRQPQQPRVGGGDAVPQPCPRRTSRCLHAAEHSPDSPPAPGAGSSHLPAGSRRDPLLSMSRPGPVRAAGAGRGHNSARSAPFTCSRTCSGVR